MMQRRSVLSGVAFTLGTCHSAVAQQIISPSALLGKWTLSTAVELTFMKIEPDGTAYGEFLDRTGDRPTNPWPMGKWVANISAGATYIDGVLRITTWSSNAFELRPKDANTLTGTFRRVVRNVETRNVTFTRV